MQQCMRKAKNRLSKTRLGWLPLPEKRRATSAQPGKIGLHGFCVMTTLAHRRGMATYSVFARVLRPVPPSRTARSIRGQSALSRQHQDAARFHRYPRCLQLTLAGARSAG